MASGTFGLWVAFAAGLVSVASPCVLPLIPSYLTYLAGSELRELNAGGQAVRWRALVGTLFFVTGFGVVFVALGLSASTVGAVLRDHQTFLRQLSGILVMLMGLYLLGLFNGLLPTGHGVRLPGGQPGAGRSFALGLAFAIGWTPCVGPILASILLVAGQAGSAGRGAALLASYAAGLAVPFLAAALGLGWFLAHVRGLQRWTPMIERVSGVLMIVLGVLLYTNSFARLSSMFASIGIG